MLEGYSIWTQSNSGQEFRESYRDGITRNYTEFLTEIGPSLDAEVMIE
jgi:hypothetical protein